RVTVPVLWDKETKRIVNNCEDDICPMFNFAFNEFASNKDVDLFPKDIAAERNKLSDFIYENINNGVYRAGFATRQQAYERACKRLFDALDEMEKRLSAQPLLVWKAHRRSGLAVILYADSVRRCLSRAFQMQSAPHSRL